MPSTPSRIEKLNESLGIEIARAIKEEVDLDTNVLVTVVRVMVSHTLEHATVWLSILPDAKIDSTLEIINKDIYAIQQELNSRLVMRKIPKISFKIDRTEERAAHIEQLIENVVK